MTDILGHIEQNAAGFGSQITPRAAPQDPGFTLPELGSSIKDAFLFTVGAGRRPQLTLDRKRLMAQDALRVRDALERGVQGDPSGFEEAQGVLASRIEVLDRTRGDSSDSRQLLEQINSGDVEGALREVGTLVEFAQFENILPPDPKLQTFSPGTQVGRPGAEGSFTVPTAKQQDRLVGISAASTLGRIFVGEQNGVKKFMQATNQAGGDPIRILEGITVPKSDTAIQFAIKKLEAEQKRESAQEVKRQEAGLVGFDIQTAIDQSTGIFSTGFSGSIVSAVPGTSAFNLKATLKSIRARVGFNKLQEMRANSPTGGALGQVSDKENELLQSVLGSIDQSQSEEQLIRNLNRMKVIFNAIVHGTASIPFTQEQFDALPVGTRYISPDTGTLHEKQ